MTDHAPNHEVSPSEDLPIACPQCFAGAIEHVRFSKDLAVVETKDGWILLGEPGHKDDVIATLGESRPTPDPDPGNTDDSPEAEASEDAFYETPEGEAQLEAGSTWLEHVSKTLTWSPELGPLGYWRLVQELISVGYDPEESGYPEIWVYDHLARLLEATEVPS